MLETPLLETRALTRRFGALQALSSMSLSVRPGTILGVIGPNGAGKSTLINVITGHLRPTAGTVLIDGTDLTGAPPWRIAHAGVARTFQIVKPFRGLTVRENVAISAMYGHARAATKRTAFERADGVLESLALAQLGRRSPAELSVGDARRLELARALAARPRLLLLDEVMAGLRAAEVETMVALIRSLRADGVTLLVVEHVIKAIAAVSDEICVLHHGEVLTRGAPQAVLSDPRVIQAYLGNRYTHPEGQR
ncbi:MAG TPA: ATP-binding cassette domain-containing protein [Pseudonocardiaceae bacterium]|jgi:branched-chain amino acid transport system ATP-binding protein|nr:ATP-binding cassette domain-containing protein [Pseudonocardiaceae bacterium]